MARQIYAIRDKIQGLLSSSPFINSIHVGQADDFVRQKKNFYPAARVDYGDATLSNEIIQMTMHVIILGQVDEEFDNENDVLNNCLTAGARLVAELQEASHDADFELNEDVQSEYLWEQEEANLAGFGLTINLTMRNTSHNAR